MELFSCTKNPRVCLLVMGRPQSDHAEVTAEYTGHSISLSSPDQTVELPVPGLVCNILDICFRVPRTIWENRKAGVKPARAQRCDGEQADFMPLALQGREGVRKR